LESVRWNHAERHPITPYVRSLALFLQADDSYAPFDAADRLDGADSRPLTCLTVVVQHGMGLSSPLTQRLAQSPHLAGIRSLTLETGIFDQPLDVMLEALAELTELRCPDVQQSDNHFQNLIQHPKAAQLETLHLEGVQDILVTLAETTHLTGLRTLEVPHSGGHNSVESAFWRRLANASFVGQLERLDVSHCLLQDHALAAFIEAAPLAALRFLNLRHNPLTEASLGLLRDGPLPKDCEVLWDGPPLERCG